jgi:uncharacterized protein
VAGAEVRLSNELVVAAPPERTWAALLDLPRTAEALPGLRLEADSGDGACGGTISIELGAVTARYRGSARIQDVDEDERVIGFFVQGHELGGPGGVSATITGRLAETGGLTSVLVETDLRLTGRQASLGREPLEDAAGTLLGELSAGLEQELAGTALALPSRGRRRRMALVGLGAAAGLAVGLVVWARR